MYPCSMVEGGKIGTNVIVDHKSLLGYATTVAYEFSSSNLWL